MKNPRLGYFINKRVQQSLKTKQICCSNANAQRVLYKFKLFTQIPLFSVPIEDKLSYNILELALF